MSDLSNPKEIVVFITAPGEDAAATIARTLVETKLAACVNIVNNIRSIYSWQGKIEDDSEVLMVVKTRAELFSALSDRVKELHPYDVPEIIALPLVDGNQEYLKWIHDSTN